jgi:elongation factor P hydroxylase
MTPCLRSYASAMHTPKKWILSPSRRRPAHDGDNIRERDGRSTQIIPFEYDLRVLHRK